MFLLVGKTWSSKYSPPTIECDSGWLVSFRFKSSLKELRLYIILDSDEFWGILVSKFPSIEPLIELTVVSARPFTFDSTVVFSVIGKTTSLLVIIGLFKSVKSNTTFPFDSFEFKIPSLSKSKSILSIIPSLSESLGQILTGITPDLKSPSLPRHVIDPTNL